MRRGELKLTTAVQVCGQCQGPATNRTHKPLRNWLSG